MEFSSYFMILLWIFSELTTTRNAHATSVFQQTTLDVTKFGAVGDGKTDDSRAFQSAWEAACKKGTNNGKVTVPSGKTFLVYPIEFEGPCRLSSITFEILGVIVAPPKSAWMKKSADAWLSFHGVDRLIVAGNGQGVIDGRGASWWNLHVS
ncbi:probable polygalacturonase At3g15720 [Sesamum indicum]|uniref:Probable polygalacturonase At3g15720 n=1 Tax=Sesamum indicum TaxID=4182 RepID=A0A8M8VFD6_SESIN|nr:probable polygalacturonase At3g15720 [Sesamum indicum]